MTLSNNITKICRINAGDSISHVKVSKNTSNSFCREGNSDDNNLSVFLRPGKTDHSYGVTFSRLRCEIKLLSAILGLIR